MGLFSKLFNKEGDGASDAKQAAETPTGGADEAGAQEASRATKPATGATERNGAGRAQPPPPPAATGTPPVLMPRTVARKGIDDTGPRTGVSPMVGEARQTPATTTGVMAAARAQGPAPPVPTGAAARPGTRRQEAQPRRPTSAGGAARDRDGRGAARAHSGDRQAAAKPPSPPAPARDGEAGPRSHKRVASPKPPPFPAARTTPGRAATGRTPARHPAGAETDDDGVVDAAFDALQGAPQTGDRTDGNQTADDARAVGETFAAVAAEHARPLSDFMAQLAMGATPSRWAAPLRAIVAPLLDAARRMELDELAAAFESFDAALAQAAEDRTLHISQGARDGLDRAYRRLVSQMPEMFDAASSDDGRKRVLLEALLLQVPALQRRTLTRLYAAGLQDLETLIDASPDEVAQVAGIEHDLAAAISQRLQRFSRERAGAEPAALRSRIHGQLGAAVERLTQMQADFERAREQDAAEPRRRARRGRQTLALEIDALLAQLGELALVEELKRKPVSGKIERIKSFLEQAQAA